ncbi:hypothetical protein PINS_up008922 [Pythium insidiosum]|nr:hypothetical protein PINS_up008922 [Pythium insidiosum]
MAAAPVSESDAAFYSFACVMLCLYIVPAVLFTFLRVVQHRSKPSKLLESWTLSLTLVGLALSIAAFWHCLQHLQDVDTTGIFDPYEILQISDGASLREIKKAFRRLGRELHPDKNRNDLQNAHARFARVTKAYEALTDPVGIENFRKYGHPDGPRSMLLSFAFLSSFSGASGSAPLFVLLYFVVIFGVIAAAVYSLHRSSGRRDRTQISNRTAALWIESFHDRMGVHDIVELLLTSEEMTVTTGGEQDLLEAQQRSKAHDKILKKMEAAKALPAEAVSRIKKQPHPIARENMIALYQYWRRNRLSGVPKPAWIDLRLHKILLEMPYLVDLFATMAAEQCVKRAYPSLPLMRVLGLLSSLAQGALVADEDALRDQRARLHEGQELPKLSVAKASMFVADESNIQPGDWITAEVQITREHLAPGESAPLASTLWDAIDPRIEFRKEHLWLVVIDKASNRVYAATKLKDLTRDVAARAVFEGPGIAGKYDMEVRVLCPAYLSVQASAVVAIDVESNKQH